MQLVNKLWGFCNKLRHDGVDPSDYIEQLTYLLFLKMAKERGVKVPPGYDWQSLISKREDALISHLEKTLHRLKSEQGILGDIFSEPVSRVRNAEILKSLIKEIDDIQWSEFNADVVGLAFEELIGKVAKEGKKGAGQYFTPRPLIQAIINVMKPDPIGNSNFKIGDVAAGTAGFLIVACEWIKRQRNFQQLNSKTIDHIVNKTFFGQELVQRPRRLALMNMFLHGINADIKLGDSIYQSSDNILFDCILTNPPFGTKGANQIPDRNFPVKTSDKQINFIQHIIEKLKIGGRAAIVLPDSCLSNEHAKKVWMHFLDKSKSKENVCNLHTVLKLPEGIFASYAQGVRACVVFLQKGSPTEQIWIYNARKDTAKITTKSNILNANHFEDFEKCYGNSPNATGNRVATPRFTNYTYADIHARGFDISFIEPYEPELLPHPVVIIDQMIADYKQKIIALEKLKKTLPNNHEYSEALGKNPTSKASNKSKREKAY